MNSDEIKQLVPVVVMVLTPLCAKYGITDSDIATWVNIGVEVVGALMLTIQHWNMKKVPETSVVAAPAKA